MNPAPTPRTSTDKSRDDLLVEKVQAALAAKDAEIAGLCGERDGWKARAEKAEAERNEAVTNLLLWQGWFGTKNLNDALAERDALRSEATQLRAEVERLKANAVFTEPLLDVHAICDQRDTLRAELENLRPKLTQLQFERDQCLAGLNQANETNETLRHRNDSLERMMLHLEWTDEQKRILSEIDQLRAELAAAKADTERWKKAAEALYFAYTPDGHPKGTDCFATGPLTGDPFTDLIACPGCAAQAAIAAARKAQP